MNCRAFHRNLEDYLEGGMDFPKRFSMERHAQQCYSCETAVSTALALRRLAHDLDRVTAPDGFERTLLAKIQTEKSPDRFWKIRDWWVYGFGGFSWRTATMVLATVIVVGSVTYLHFGSGGRLPSEAPAADAASRGAMLNLGASISEEAILKLIRSGEAEADKFAQPFADPSDTDFVEVPVPVSGDRQLILRLPRTIRMRYTQPSKDYLLRTISH